MSPESVPYTEPQPQGMSEFSRLTGIFFEPKKTFEDIAQRPRWIVPMIVVILSALAVSFTVSSRVGWDRIIRRQLEMSPRAAEMSAEQREQMVQMQSKFAPVVSVAGPIVGIPVVYLVISGLLLGIFAGIMSAPIKFKQVFAVQCYSSMVGVLSSILTVIVVFLKNPDDVNLQNPLAFNPGAFLDPQSGSKFVYSLATSLDLFSLWTIFLIATGLKTAAGKKLSFGGALAGVMIPWAIYVLGKAAVSGLFTR